MHKAFILLFVSCVTSGFANSKLDELIPSHNCRYPTFAYALKLMAQRGARIIVETGTARLGKYNSVGDGSSTLIFAQWATQHGALLYSIDIDKEALLTAERDLDIADKKSVHFIHSDSVKYLAEFNQVIDFLYLDSYDFEIANPLPSQQHHLKEIIAAYPCLTENSVIMIDDCGLPFGGKGKLVINYLTSRGWKIVAQGYQVILTKEPYLINCN